MKFTEATLGRIFILRLEHGDKIPDVIEEFAISKEIKAASLLFLGGAEENSTLVVGPEDGKAEKIIKNTTILTGVSEAAGVGTIFTNEEDQPKLHMHSAFGRNRETITGCTRDGVTIWNIGEVVILELINHAAGRKIDPKTGFELLEVQ